MVNKNQSGNQHSQKQESPAENKKVVRGLLNLGHAFFNQYVSNSGKADKDKKAEHYWLGGATPASNVSVSIGSFEYTKGQPFPTGGISYQNLTVTGRVEAGPNETTIIRPATNFMLQGETKTVQALIDPVQMLRTKIRMTDTVVYGTIRFTDIFNQLTMVDFCRVWEVYADGTDGYLDCPEHNASHE